MCVPIKKSKLDLIIQEMESCKDYRDQSKIHYPLIEILFLSFCASVCGCDEYTEIIDFGEAKLEWLRQYLSYENGIPSADTLSRVLGLIHTKELEKIFIKINDVLPLPEGSLVNLDGKRLARSATIKEQQTKKAEGGKQAITMLNVFCCELNSCLASLEVSDKSNEKNALDSVFSFLDLEGSLLSADAAFCYKDVTEKIIEAKCDYLIGLKANQPTLFTLAESLFAEIESIEIYDTGEEKNRGRIEQRVCKVLEISTLTDDLYEKHQQVFKDWKDLKILIKVESTRIVERTGKQTKENRYYICSKNLTACQANNSVRQHWQIENGLHWILDTAFREDQSRKRVANSAANFSLIRKLAYNKLKSFEDPKVSIKRKMRKCLMNEKYFHNVLNNL